MQVGFQVQRVCTAQTNSSAKLLTLTTANILSTVSDKHIDNFIACIISTWSN